jgi:stage II sporulation protein P
MHDSTQYKDSYANAAETIKKYLEKYPSIELVIDVHRDAVIKSSGEVVKAVTEVDGKAAAQVMCVVGTDFGGEECPRWEDNLSLALKLRSALNDSYENICRPVTLKSSTYNQEFSKYSILLEIGTSGNSLEEAKISAELVAQAISDLLK